MSGQNEDIFTPFHCLSGVFRRLLPPPRTSGILLGKFSRTWNIEKKRRRERQYNKTIEQGGIKVHEFFIKLDLPMWTKLLRKEIS